MAFPDKPVAHLVGSNGPVHALTYSTSPGTYILTGSTDRSIRLYNPQPSSSSSNGSSNGGGVASSRIGAQRLQQQQPAIPEGRLIQTYAAHGYEVLSLAVNRDNARFASSGGDRSVFLWDVATAQTLRRFGGGSAQAHTARINSVCFGGSPNSSDVDSDSVLVSGSLDTTVRVWDCRSGGGGGGRPVQVLAEARDAVTAVAVRGAEILAGSVDGRLRSYDIRTGRCTTDVVGPSVTSLALTRDAKAVLVGALDSKVRMMDRETGGCLKQYSDPDGLWRNEDLRVQSILGGKEQYVLAGDEMTGGGTGEKGVPVSKAGEGRVWAWDVLTGNIKAKVTVPWGPPGHEPKRAIGRDGREKTRNNVISCIAWRDDGFGDQWCAGGTSGIVTVFGYH